MPTEQGGETIGERLSRLRAELARVRATISRSETNGADASMGGVRITQIAYEQALKREEKIQEEITRLERRLANVSSSDRIALLKTSMPSCE